MKYSDFEKNDENPFLKQAIEQVEKNVVKKYRSSSGTSRSAILHACDPLTGEIVGHTSFIRQIEVDEQQFTKIYLSGFKSFFDLSERALRIFGYILTKLIPNSDQFMFFVDECSDYSGYKTKKAIYQGLAELLQAQIIAKGKMEYFFFINISVLFNGNRLTFARTYIKKTKEKEAFLKDKNELAENNQLSLDLFDDNE